MAAQSIHEAGKGKYPVASDTDEQKTELDGTSSIHGGTTPAVNAQSGAAGGAFAQSFTASPGTASNAAPATTAKPRYAGSSKASVRADQPDDEDSGDEAEWDRWCEQRHDAALKGDLKAYEKAAKQGLKSKAPATTDELLNLTLGESELDLAILAGSGKWTKILLKRGCATGSWKGLDDEILKRLPELFSTKDEEALEKAMAKRGLEMQQLATANTGTELLSLACRINSLKLAQAWIKAHPESLTINKATEKNVMQRNALEVPIRANSRSITKLMLDLGAVPGLMEVGRARGELKELLQQAYDATPMEQRY
jgi:hypothetical protein